MENLAPANGRFLTPVWIGVHDGTFDVFDSGSPASAELERLAEDGSVAPLSGLFDGSAAGTVQSTVFGPTIPPIAPGESSTITLAVDAGLATSRYLSFASMVIPSNDAFVGNGGPLAHEIIDGGGNFIDQQIMVMGSQVWDTGSEVNDETPANTAFFGQAAPDTGVEEGGNVALHGGFNAPGGGGILDDAMFSGADFTAGGYQVMRITITELALKPTEVTVTVENLAPASGTFLTPVWVGIHDGTFDVFKQGDPASAELERLAEDGNTGPLDTLFGGSSAGDWQATIASGGAIPPFAPGEMNSTTILIEGSLPTSRYLSYASMAIPSNDAFVGNGDPKAFQIFDHNGDFIGGQMIVMGSQVWDAGTEVNDEAPANTAFFG